MTDNDTDAISFDDLFKRGAEARMIEAFIKGASEQARNSPSKGALTLAIDAGYGEGKTFFLKRLAERLRREHPVAFVDAWTDDLADDPLTALVATLKEAIVPIAESADGEDVSGKLKAVLEKSGKIAKIVGIGLFKRALGLAITGTAVEASAHILSGAGGEVQEAIQSNLESSGDDAVAAVRSLSSTKPLSLMEQRVSDFETGRMAMTELKSELEGLITSLDSQGQKPPIVIVIDELDRCRPTYAIKLLEEIKHLFDVPGLVFIFGMHTGALAHSVKVAYGSDFDGAAYLRRFIQRRYQLAKPSHATYVENLLRQSGLKESVFAFNKVTRHRQSASQPSLSFLISEYMKAYEVSARDAVELVGMLETAAAICDRHDKKLLAAYLIPLAIGQMRGFPKGALPQPTQSFGFDFIIGSRNPMSGEEVSPTALADRLMLASMLSYDRLAEMERSSVEDAVFYTMTGNDPEPISSAPNYPRLLSQVAMFERAMSGQ